MKHIHRYITVRLVAALLVTVAVIVLSTLATHAPTRNQSSLTYKATSFYAGNRVERAWFCEAVVMTENLKSVAATL